MSFKRFFDDVRQASATVKSQSFSYLLAINRGDSDGEVILSYIHHALAKLLEIRLVAQKPTEYPAKNDFLVFTIDENVPECVASRLEDLQQFSSGKTVFEMAFMVRDAVTEVLDANTTRTSHVHDEGAKDTKVLPESPAHNEEAEDSEVQYNEEAEDDEGHDDEAEDNEMLYDGIDMSDLEDLEPKSSTLASSLEMPVTLSRIRRDLRKVREAGFKIGIVNGAAPTSMPETVSISIRANKLGVSEDTLEAWDISTTSYIVLLVHVQGRYPTFENVIASSARDFSIKFRIGSCDKYKPSWEEVSELSYGSKTLCSLDLARNEGPAAPREGRFSTILISNSLEQFMNKTFLSLVKTRVAFSYSWDEANEWYKDKQGNLKDDATITNDPDLPTGCSDIENSFEYHVQRGPSTSDASDSGDKSPEDHLTEEGERSIPLIAMQFAMRYLTRCTEFCLCCHGPIEDGFEALKPQVCSNPLCLFQSSTMGFGPSIEHEILAQPYVVDLLTSFCYEAVQTVIAQHVFHTDRSNLAIRELPIGLHFTVPNIYDVSDTSPAIKIKANCTLETVILENAADLARLSPNMWVAIQRRYSSQSVWPDPHSAEVYHGCIMEVNTSTKSVVVDPRGRSVTATQAATSTQNFHAGPSSASAPPAGRVVDMEMYLYDVPFDDLTDSHKAWLMWAVIDTIPPILQIRDHLVNHINSDLRSFNKVSSAAAALLEWILATNRSCIFQVNPPPILGADGRFGIGGAGLKMRQDEKIPGANGWVQFRLAQGSPDKELRFAKALKDVAARRNLTHPTLFAWHGSALQNWHSILRHGLDFKKVHNGRAFGNGVYFSPQFSTSCGYTLSLGREPWPNSSLKMSSALSLNEIINAPDEFVSTTPHYVVSQVDWIQCRYLFVNCSESIQLPGATTVNHSDGSSKPEKAIKMFEQDPSRPAFGPNSLPLKIPAKAIRSSHLLDKKPSLAGLQAQEARDVDTDVEDASDIEFLFSDEESGELQKATTPSNHDTPGSSVDALEAQAPSPHLRTDFRPGDLDLESLPRLKPPSWANDSATRQIAREVKKLVHVQENTPLHELGWYIDFGRLDNMFQWIVELHSFDSDLALAQDMETASITSIVLEIHFGRNFPFSPPFVRVVRPRFLPFMNGGGGHVTIGGAMCMELLTNSGWSPANSMESVLVQVRMALCSTDPQPARLEQTRTRAGDYSMREAVDAYVRACQGHGWQVPNDLAEMMNISHA
ncbi:polymerase [Pleurostoma richardsiae]|uniref:Polymerase n=1 Tax=Pleurostoma richardsiae TaxID=41990 RepID=A0AA38RJ63_9PEZI|nr:polymerase [Pleurostoma richardsiae]